MRALALIAVMLSTPALAVADDGDDDGEPPVHFELGLNTRHFSASAGAAHQAFRTETGVEPAPPGTPAGSGVTASLRFTKWTRWSTFLGIEAETGALTERNSNVAAGYGLVGYRGELGRFTVGVELAPGKRWIRYNLMDETHETYLVETRVRAQTWISARFTLGAAAGATVTGDVRVWMAGVYVGVHSLDYGKL